MLKPLILRNLSPIYPLKIPLQRAANV